MGRSRLDTSAVREVLERVLAVGSVVAPDGSVHELFPVAIPGGEGEALREWVVREDAERTVEIGLGYGISMLFVCEGLLANGHPGASHVAIDPHQATRFADCGLQLIAAAGLEELVELHSEESQVVLPRLLADRRRFDLAFVDGSHLFDGVFLDLVYLGRLVRGRGVVFVDDYQLPAVERATSYCVTNLGLTIEDVDRSDPDHNWAVLRLPAEPLDRPWDHFVDF